MAQEHNTRPHKRLVVLLVSVMAIGLALGLVTFAGAAALPSDSNVTADRPDSQTVEFEAGFGDTTQPLNVSLVSDGTTVESTSVSGTNETVSGSLDMTGLQTGDYEVVAESHPSAEIQNTTMVTSLSDAMNVSENDTVLVDVGFDSDKMASANVTFSQGSNTNSTSLSFDPVEVADGTGTETAEYEAESTGNVSVVVETTSAFAYDGVWISQDTGGGIFGAGGVIAGASNTQIYGFFALVVGLVVAYNRDYL
jgi:hypothetical protein